LGVAWTLVHEVLFYAVFALTIAFRRWGWGLFAVWQLAIAVSWAKNWDFSDVGGGHYLLSPANLLFPLGLAASSLPQLRKLPAWLLFGFGSVAFLCIMLLSHPAGGWQISSDQSRSLVAGVAAFLIIWAGTQEAVELKLGAWASRLGLLGDASYSIYLVHYPVLSLLSKLMPRLSPPIFFCTVSVVSVLCGIVFHRVVEKRIIKNV
jgi:peptidoglycan/LPS O-acetylase OafA/YrhL